MQTYRNTEKISCASQACRCAPHAHGAPGVHVRERRCRARNRLSDRGGAPAIDGVDFEDACRAREEVEIESIGIPVIIRLYLAQNKEATGRPHDQVVLAWLRNESSEGEDEDAHSPPAISRSR